MKKMLCKIKIDIKCAHKKVLKTKNLPCLHWNIQFSTGKPKFTHAFSHYCLPFLDVFGQIMHSYKSFWVNLINTYGKFLQKFSFVVACRQALENACPKQVHWKLSSKSKISQFIIDLKL
jgi:hypothetical protein